MLFFSKPLALMASSDGLASNFAVNAIGSSTSPTLYQIFHTSNKLSSWFWQEQKGLYTKYRNYGSQSSAPPMLPVPTRISSNCLPPSGSSRPPFNFGPPASFYSRSESSPYFVSPKQIIPPPRKIEANHFKDVPSSLKFTVDTRTSKVRHISIYRHTQGMLRPPVRGQMIGSRSLHTSRITHGKSNSDSGKDCKPTTEICRSKKDTCGDTTSCKDKDAECYPEKVKCEPQRKLKKEVDEEKQVCPTSCVRGGKCIIAASQKPAKMVYGSTECPPPKLVSPRTCPRRDSNEYTNDKSVCNEKVVTKKLRKDVCTPPPLPGPPTDPVPLCPCPPPAKLHPGPCPCPVHKEEVKIKQTPPCPIKDKYPCCLPIYYCPPKKPCVRKLPCDQTKKTKSCGD